MIKDQGDEQESLRNRAAFGLDGDDGDEGEEEKA
jgi:hypothetical protein